MFGFGIMSGAIVVANGLLSHLLFRPHRLAVQDAAFSGQRSRVRIPLGSPATGLCHNKEMIKIITLSLVIVVFICNVKNAF